MYRVYALHVLLHRFELVSILNNAIYEIISRQTCSYYDIPRHICISSFIICVYVVIRVESGLFVRVHPEHGTFVQNNFRSGSLWFSSFYSIPISQI